MSRSKRSCSSLPWEVGFLVARHLDPKTISVASCVCKSWFSSMSSDHLWEPLCSTHYPSLSKLQLTDPPLSYSRLFGISYTASKRRCHSPSKPSLSLDNLVFAINVHTDSALIVTVVKPGNELSIDPNGVFRFDIDVNHECLSMSEVLERVKITWNVVLKGWTGLFTMMDCEGKVSNKPAAEGYFSEELPLPSCCSNAVKSSIAADMKLGLCSKGESGGKVRVGKISVGMMSLVDWRYVTLEDGLKYLQHFLLPCQAN